jgi:glutamate formiminotransferase/formiminotetrahydrofolate cyclodeaminase
MRKIIECVPNFSEGQNQETIDAIANAIKEVPGVTLLDVDPGFSTNRTVYTFVGDPESVVEGALASARVARELIDMRNHKGEHDRMGAMDVCPFVPVAGVTMDDCIECANEFGRRAAEELDIPIYLYEAAAKEDYRRKMPDIRKGQYEGLAKKIVQPEWKPDYGKAEFDAKWGATATGARFFLVAYNINIIGTSNQAHRIALNLREKGRGPDKPGRLKDVQAMGWFVDEYNLAQITANLMNYRETGLHTIFEEAKKDADEINVALAGSELVGLVPLETMLTAADYFIEKEGLFILDEEQKIKLVTERLGLSSISQFDPKKRIIEYMIEEKREEPLASMTVRGFTEEIAARTSAPGGGSAAASIAAIGAGLGTMVAQLTYGVRKFEHLDAQIRAIIPPLNDAVQKLIPCIDADTNAFNDYMDALRMPKATDEEKAARETAMQEGLKTAINVPLTTMKYGDAAWDMMIEISKIGNYNSRSDIEVGARALEVGIWGAFKNVEINLDGIKDEKYKTDIHAEAKTIADRAKEKCQECLDIIEKRNGQA